MTNPTTQPNENLWERVLDQLQLQMTRATFDTWLKDTSFISSDNGWWKIGVKNELAIDWLENRLHHTINRTVTDLTGQQIKLTYVYLSPVYLSPEEVEEEQPDPQPTDEDRPTELTTAQKIAQADPYTAHFVRGSSGFMMVSNYQNIYWMAYLGGEAYALWQRLANEKTVTVKKVQDRWTESKRYSYTELAGWLNLSHSCYISGCVRECHNSRLHVAHHDEQIPECCRNHYPFARVKIDPRRRKRCMFWRTGLLQVLYREKLVAIREVKPSNKKAVRSHVLEIQTWRVLPPLVPSQIAQLKPDLQKAHDLWLDSWGPKLYDVSLPEWKEISEKTLVAAMTGYDDYRKLDGPYFPDEHFYRLKQQGFT